MLTYYELDLGLNHVIRKWSEAVDPKSNMLVAGKKQSTRQYIVRAENCSLLTNVFITMI